MEIVENANRLQTLQIYRKVERVPADVQIRKMLKEVQSIKIAYPRHEKKRREGEINPKVEDELADPPRIKTIELQNTLTKMEKELAFWVNDYRTMIDERRELDRTIPRTEHELEESDQKAQENVDKIIKIESIKDKMLQQYKDMCIRYEETDETSRRQIRKLENELYETRMKNEEMEYRLNKMKKC
jgi:chromosome segregation ATPase